MRLADRRCICRSAKANAAAIRGRFDRANRANPIRRPIQYAIESPAIAPRAAATSTTASTGCPDVAAIAATATRADSLGTGGKKPSSRHRANRMT
ncbi:hypothetical protein N8H09_06440 [Curtobacterium flaccumfaciens]|nr:hypothetical protein [Curtobacterium flaccumfaciens]MCU0114420.1 hypothetical protein [Curtobacterium flaccumfaciens]